MYKKKNNTKYKNMNTLLKNAIIINYISNLTIILIITFLILLFIFANIHLKITHYQNELIIIKITISDLLKIKLEYNIKMKPLNKYTFRKSIFIMKKIHYLKTKYDYLIKEITKKIKITKLSIIANYANANPIIDSYIKFGTLMIYNTINQIINDYFQNCDNNYFKILDNDESNKINYEIEFSIRTYQIWKILISNLKEFKEIKKEF